MQQNVTNFVADRKSLNDFRVAPIHSYSKTAASTAQGVFQYFPSILAEGTFGHGNAKGRCHPGNVDGDNGSVSIENLLNKRLSRGQFAAIVGGECLQHQRLFPDSLKLKLDLCGRMTF